MDLPACVRTLLVLLVAVRPRILARPFRLLQLPSLHRWRSASVELLTAPAPLADALSLDSCGASSQQAVSWIAEHARRTTRGGSWVVPLRSRYRRLGRSRGAMSGARRATVVTSARFPPGAPDRGRPP